MVTQTKGEADRPNGLLGVDWAALADDFSGPITHEDRMIALLAHFAAAGRTLAWCTQAHVLNRKRRTLERYCRLGGVIFPDYCPQDLRPPKQKGPSDD